MRPSHRKHNRMWPRRPYERRIPFSAVSASMILKDLYPQSRIGGGGPKYYAIPTEMVYPIVGSAEWKREQRHRDLFSFDRPSPFMQMLAP